jgi:dihydrodipicolinate reductase
VLAVGNFALTVVLLQKFSEMAARLIPQWEIISAEVIFGMPDQRLTIRHDSGTSARPYVDGALLAIRKVHALVGVHRGLDTVLEV